MDEIGERNLFPCPFLLGDCDVGVGSFLIPFLLEFGRALVDVRETDRPSGKNLKKAGFCFVIWRTFSSPA